MQAFHNDPAIKQKYIDRVAAHRVADELIKDVGWNDGEGCAIGCTLESYNHSAYEDQLGIPQMLARLEDCIFEGLDNGLSQAWPERFLQAITPGADLSRVGWKFLLWLLTNSGIGAYQHELVKDAVAQCATVLVLPALGFPADTNAAKNAARTARVAANATNGDWAAASAANSGRCAVNAVRSLVNTARSAEWSAAIVERRTMSVANGFNRANTNGDYEKMADKLIELLAYERSK